MNSFTKAFPPCCLKAGIFDSFQQAKFVGNQAKGQISKRALQEKKARQIFRNLPRDTLVYISEGKIQEIWHALFYCNTRFEICPSTWFQKNSVIPE